eukprot:12881555-Prorocentrum_lima.AAC.1
MGGVARGGRIQDKLRLAVQFANKVVPQCPRKPRISSETFELVNQLHSLRKLHDQARRRLSISCLRNVWNAFLAYR